MKSHLQPVADFEPNSKSVKSNKRFYPKKYQNDNQQKCIDCLKPKSNKNERVCKKCGCDYFCVPRYEQFVWLGVK